MGDFPNKATQFSSENQPEKNGRHKKLPALDVLMERVMGEEKDGISAMEAILMKLRQQAASGNIKAAEILLERGYGKSRQSMDLNLTNPEAIRIIRDKDL
jgi:hypothetical protein